MKSKIKSLLATVGLLALLTGCVSPLTKYFNPKVVGSDIDATVERSRATKGKYASEVQAEQLKRARAEARQEIALAKIKGSMTGSKSPEEIITKDGMTGGNPVIVFNDASRDSFVTVRKTSGDYAGVVWAFDLPRIKGKKILYLEKDKYEIKWTFEQSSTVYPRSNSGDDRYVTVHDSPVFPFERDGKTYYGAYRISGRGGY